MIALKKNQLLVALATTCIFSTAYGQKNEMPKRELWFEVATGKISFPVGRSRMRSTTESTIRKEWT